MNGESEKCSYPVLKQQWATWWSQQRNWKTIAELSRHTQIAESSLRDYRDGKSFPQGKNAEILYRTSGIECLTPHPQLQINKDESTVADISQVQIKEQDNKGTEVAFWGRSFDLMRWSPKFGQVVKSGFCSYNEYGIGGEHETEPKKTQPIV